MNELNDSALFKHIPDEYNGMTFCVGSLASRYFFIDIIVSDNKAVNVSFCQK